MIVAPHELLKLALTTRFALSDPVARKFEVTGNLTAEASQRRRAEENTAEAIAHSIITPAFGRMLEEASMCGQTQMRSNGRKLMFRLRELLGKSGR
jgi:hypothetical protein